MQKEEDEEHSQGENRESMTAGERSQIAGMEPERDEPKTVSWTLSIKTILLTKI